MPIVSDLKNPTLEARHWDEISLIINYNVRENVETTTLGTLIDLNVMKFQEEIGTICGKAVQEAELKKMLLKIEREWKDLALVVILYKEQKDNFVLGGLDDVIAKLDESLVAINIVLGSRFVEPIRTEVTEWSRRLLLFSETIDEWMTCQKNWMYGSLARQSLVFVEKCLESSFPAILFWIDSAVYPHFHFLNRDQHSSFAQFVPPRPPASTGTSSRFSRRPTFKSSCRTTRRSLRRSTSRGAR